VVTASTDMELESQALSKSTRRVVVLVLALVAALLLIGALVPIRYVAQTWSEDDVVECQASAFVGDAARDGGERSTEAAIRDCVAHRRAKRWGPWGAFGSADDSSRYNAADD
jgi:hypothetical protein